MKNNRIWQQLILIVPFVMLLLPGSVFAANSEEKSNDPFHHYYFMEGTFYKYTADTLEEYFDYAFVTNASKIERVNWKEMNQTVIKILAEEQERLAKEKIEEKQTEEMQEETDTSPENKKPSSQQPTTEQSQKLDEKKPTKEPESKPKINPSEFEQEVILLTNKEREKHGLAPLKIDTELATVARKKSADMAEQNYFSHDSPTYGSPFDMMEAFGITYYSAGENIAKGQTTPAEVVQAWMASEGHRENILHPDFTHIGVGYVESGNYWTQQFIKRIESTVKVSAFEQSVVDLTNQERAKHGLAALQMDPLLAKSARAKSLDMAEQDYFDHTSPTYGSPFDMMEEFGVAYKTAGENIARGQFTPEEVVSAWMNSEGHRANILNANYTHIGVGFVKEGIIWTQQFIGK